MPLSPSAISSLRHRTGVSILACKEALDEAAGDEEKAIEILRKKGIAQAAKKAVREQHEGYIFSAQAGVKVAMVLLGCETDFVARDTNFQNLGKELTQILLEQGEVAAKAAAGEKIPAMIQKLGENISVLEAHTIEVPVIGAYIHSNGKIGVLIGLDTGTVEQARDTAMHAAAFNPSYVNPEEVSADVIAKEKEIWREQLKKEGKPEAILDKIMMGKEKKFREENALMKQPFAKDSSKTVEQYLGGAKIMKYVRLSVS